MRYLAFTAFVCLASFTFGWMQRPEPSSESCDAQPAADIPCDNLTDAHQGEPTSIDDRQMKRRLSNGGGALIESGETPDMRGLVKQLGLESCKLDLPEEESSLPEGGNLYDHAKESIVVISGIYKCNRCNDWHSSCASGFVISDSGAVVTNYHVVDNPERKALVAMTADGRVLPVKRVLAASRANDLAILQVEGKDLKPLRLAASPAKVGEPIGLVSHPDEKYYFYSSGVVSRYVKRKFDGHPVEAMTITADFARGSSGAPVLNDRGEVVGIVRSTESIYYDDDHGRQENLQMVIKTCVPTASLWKLIEPAS